MENILSVIALKEVFCQTGEKLSIDFCFRIEKGKWDMSLPTEEADFLVLIEIFLFRQKREILTVQPERKSFNGRIM